MTLWLFALLALTAPDPYRTSARTLKRLRTAVAKGQKKSAVAFLNTLREAPEPFPQLATLELLRLPLTPGEKRIVLKNLLPFYGRVLAGERQPKSIKAWLTAETCATDVRVKLLREAANLSPPRGSVHLYWALWMSLPGHPQGVDHLRLALAVAVKHELPIRAKLQEYLLNYHPESIPEAERAALLAKLDCTIRAKLTRGLFKRGLLALVPGFLKGCSAPMERARLATMKGDYKGALSLLTPLPKDAAVQKMIARARVHVVPPSLGAKHHMQLWLKTKSPKELRRAVKTFLLAGDYATIYATLGSTKYEGSYLTFMHGYSAYRTRHRHQALKIWRARRGSAWGREREQLDYWINKASGTRYKQTVATRKPVRSFYMRSAAVMQLPGGMWPAPLPLMLRQPRATGWHLREALKKSASNHDLSVGLALLEQGFHEYARQCLYRGLARSSKRKRRLRSELWKCWDLAEGNPPECKDEVPRYTKGAAMDPVTQSRIALGFNWPHLAPRWGRYLPRPYLKEVIESARRHNVPAALLYGIMLSESHFEPYIVSHASALGLFQVIPPTGMEIATDLGRPSFHVGELLDPLTAIEFGAAYIAKLGRTFKGVWPLAVAAYNAGPHQVKRWLRGRRSIDADAFIEEIPFGETRTYVKLVMGRYALYARELGEKAPTWPTTFGPIL